MPTFHFHLAEPCGVIEDPEGAVHADIDAAVASAMRQMRGMVSHEIVETGQVDLTRAIDIVSPGLPVRRVAFSQAISVSV